MTGFICLDKAEGISSFGAIARLRRICGEKKAGHTGTLDPMATGVLPVALGFASRFIPYLPYEDKAYIARFKLGITTDTLDTTGTLLAERPVKSGHSDVLGVLEGFRGNIKQIPPMYSAISQNGQRLYDLARQGIEVEREARAVFIESLELTGCFENNEYEINVACSKGTYIRSLIADIGEALDCGAAMTALRRTKSNGFSIENSFSEEDIAAAFEAGKFEKVVIPVDKIFELYPSVHVSEAQAVRFKNGGALDTERLRDLKDGGLYSGMYRVYSPKNEFLGLGNCDEGAAQLAPKRIYN